MNKEPIIFIDTIDMEERYAESLYIDYLKEENKQLKDRIDKAIEYIEVEGEHTDYSGEPIYYLDEEQEEELLEILKGGNNEC